ncbi:hypothetical protein C0993_003472 [Termitomyces sp. T159_Od127]|nr:hypothetical protein C0993_003472 [Termitomyces sp. T159_Od127]
MKVFAPPYVGSTQVHKFPPASPTNANPTLSPSNVGYPGGTPTGAEPNVIETAPAYPIHSGAAQLVSPNTSGSKAKEGKKFDLFRQWVGRDAPLRGVNAYESFTVWFETLTCEQHLMEDHQRWRQD